VVADGSPDPFSEPCSNPEDVAQIAQALAGRVRSAFARRRSTQGSEVRHADLAKDQAKAALRIAGGATARNALEPLDEISWVSRLHRALANDEFVLHYQPVWT
jgi:sensor c-di-GMP phosphodiesterase-like protein